MRQLLDKEPGFSGEDGGDEALDESGLDDSQTLGFKTSRLWPEHYGMNEDALVFFEGVVAIGAQHSLVPTYWKSWTGTSA